MKKLMWCSSCAERARQRRQQMDVSNTPVPSTPVATTQPQSNNVITKTTNHKYNEYKQKLLNPQAIPKWQN